MIDDPAVQSVRVAVALCDRFAELLKGPSQVTARKQEGALIGFAGDQEGFSLRIGEAQQIYPEIWRHLDDARTAFAARGIDVTGFDSIRASEGRGLGAAVDIEHTTRGAGRHAVHESVKSANFNEAGLARAKQACAALMAATPQIDWNAIASAEANDPNVAAFARATRTKRWAWFGVLALVIATPFLAILYMQHRRRAELHEARTDRVPTGAKLDDAERTELASLVAKRRASVAAARQRWATAATLDSLKPLARSIRPCDAAVRAPLEQSADAYIRTGEVAKDLQASRFDAFVAGDVGNALPDRELQSAEAALSIIDQRLHDGTADDADRARVTELEAFTTYLVIDRDVEPAITAPPPKLAYQPGEISGRAYVFSLDDGAFVCVADIAVRNSPGERLPKFLEGVATADAAQEALHRELEIELRRALAARLRAVAH